MRMEPPAVTVWLNNLKSFSPSHLELNRIFLETMLYELYLSVGEADWSIHSWPSRATREWRPLLSAKSESNESRYFRNSSVEGLWTDWSHERIFRRDLTEKWWERLLSNPKKQTVGSIQSQYSTLYCCSGRLHLFARGMIFAIQVNIVWCHFHLISNLIFLPIYVIHCLHFSLSLFYFLCSDQHSFFTNFHHLITFVFVFILFLFEHHTYIDEDFATEAESGLNINEMSRLSTIYSQDLVLFKF